MYNDDRYFQVALDGAWVEDKVVSLTYHYRNAPAELKEAFTNEARTLIKYYGFKAVQAHGAIEIKPPVVWSKGDAAKIILREEFGEHWATNNTKILFAGDDNSDEDVMKVSKQLKHIQFSSIPRALVSNARIYANSHRMPSHYCLTSATNLIIIISRVTINRRFHKQNIFLLRNSVHWLQSIWNHFRISRVKEPASASATPQTSRRMPIIYCHQRPQSRCS